ncbi:hypothetical protein ACFCV3_19530 [Kribbella sp. NPDC056345]|uniref:hypothetical protein n=1 Tax=Kribbella sp. NPDC056345 TaxID=3345789 RepID=UPI0035E22183
MIEDLVEIGLDDGFLGDDYQETRRIGECVNAIGGMGEMLAVHREVSRHLINPSVPRELERAWDGIGTWFG